MTALHRILLLCLLSGTKDSQLKMNPYDNYRQNKPLFQENYTNKGNKHKIEAMKHFDFIQCRIS